MPATFTRFPSPLGELILTASDTALTGVHFPTSRHLPPLHGVERRTAGEDDGDGPASALLARARHQLDEYFARTRTTFDLPLDPPGTTFQRVVWDLLRATRAVGAANGKNPIPIIVPCHRVVGARGELTGFGGGLDRKRWLLEHEGARLMLL